MKKVETLSGYSAYYAEYGEIAEKILSGNRCDCCNSTINSGYLIPVLNTYICKSCFDKWNESDLYYEDDRKVDELRSQAYEKLIGLED